MDKVANLSADQRRDLFRETAAKRAMNPAIVEKDFWVCWVLKHLFADATFGERIIFKGGTSLSKVFGLIDRFSEDVDLILDWRLLGYGPGQQDPFQDSFPPPSEIASTSSSTSRPRPTLLTRSYRNWSVSLPRVRRSGVSLTPMILRRSTSLIRRHSPKTTCVLKFGLKSGRLHPGSHPIATSSSRMQRRLSRASSTNPTAWSWRSVRSGHSGRRPPSSTSKPTARPRCRCAIRDTTMTCTNWPKARPRMPRSRDLALLRDVVAFKQRFYPSRWARYEDAQPGTFKLIPAAERIAELRRDYHDMEMMIFGDVPTFDDITDTLRRLEGEINASKSG